MLNSYGHFMFLLFLVFNNIFKYQLLRAFDHICMEKACYKFLIIFIYCLISFSMYSLKTKIMFSTMTRFNFYYPVLFSPVSRFFFELF